MYKFLQKCLINNYEENLKLENINSLLKLQKNDEIQIYVGHYNSDFFLFVIHYKITTQSLLQA